MKHFNMKLMFGQARVNADFFRYFPDSCFKKYPPRSYFWQIYASLHPEQFGELYNVEMERIRQRRRRPQNIPVARENLVLLQANQ